MWWETERMKISITDIYFSQIPYFLLGVYLLKLRIQYKQLLDMCNYKLYSYKCPPKTFTMTNYADM